MTKNACEFLKQVSTISKEKDDNTVNIQKLNNKQRTVFNRIETHYNNILVDKWSKALRIIIMGTAETGKSYLIRTIRKKLNTIAECRQHTPVQVIAFTGVTAFNINRSTIHSMLSVLINNSNKNGELDCNQLKQLQDVIYLIINEKSIVGCKIIALIDMRLR